MTSEVHDIGMEGVEEGMEGRMEGRLADEDDELKTCRLALPILVATNHWLAPTWLLRACISAVSRNPPTSPFGGQSTMSPGAQWCPAATVHAGSAQNEVTLACSAQERFSAR